jgi:deoxycytidine triphosphate deaminase
MPLSALKVLELNKQYNLIEKLSERELENPEGVEIELRVGRVEIINDSSFLGVAERSSPSTELIADIERDGNKKIIIKPGDYLLVRTIEKINCPSEKVKFEDESPARYLMPNIYPRTSLQRSGISLHCSTTNPGYSGQLVFGLKNNSKEKFIFELGARMFKLVFEPVIGEIKRTYSGQHQGGRISSQGEFEVQN